MLLSPFFNLKSFFIFFLISIIVFRFYLIDIFPRFFDTLTKS